MAVTSSESPFRTGTPMVAGTPAERVSDPAPTSRMAMGLKSSRRPGRRTFTWWRTSPGTVSPRASTTSTVNPCTHPSLGKLEWSGSGCGASR
jgi:hypothetical protein